MNMRNLLLSSFAAVALLASASGTATAASQTWYLGADDTLYADKAAMPPADTVTVFDGQGATFFAVDPAAVDIDFGTGTFSWSIQTTVPFNGNFRVMVGHGNGNEFSVGASFFSAPVSTTASSGQTVFTGTISVTDFEVPAGSFLGFGVENLADPGVKGSKMTVVVGDEDSQFTTTSADPGYPTPELGTLALAGAGLGVVAVVALRRRG